MIKLTDGPAAGSYAVKRAPLYLRAVVLDSEKDVLDRIEDTPHELEAVYVYKRDGEAGAVHLNFGGGKSRARTGFYATGVYRHLPDVDGKTVRESTAWRAWVEAQVGGPIDPETGVAQT